MSEAIVTGFHTSSGLGLRVQLTPLQVSQAALRGLALSVERGSTRLVVKNHHDYLFKCEGQVVATITKKSFTYEGRELATGADAKQLWEETRMAFGHTLAGLV